MSDGCLYSVNELVKAALAKDVNDIEAFEVRENPSSATRPLRIIFCEIEMGIGFCY